MECFELPSADASKRLSYLVGNILSFLMKCVPVSIVSLPKGDFMKIRRSLVAVGAAIAIATAGTPAASAAEAPEPLATVLTQIANTAGYHAQNIILVPALTSSLGFLGNLLFR